MYQMSSIDQEAPEDTDLAYLKECAKSKDRYTNNVLQITTV